VTASSSNAERPRPSPSATAPPPKEIFAATGEHTFRVVLRHPDPDLPRLVSNPVFRPVYGGGDERGASAPAVPMATNGAFDVVSVDAGGVVLERSDTYWNRRSVKLERVRFVPMPSAEHALEAYRAGELDAVTNAEFAPAALKLLTPYDDFLRTTHGALNFYEVNAARPPFSDRRVRIALSAAIDRERLTAGEMEGLTRPAYSLLPFGPSRTMNRVAEDADLARGLLEEAGYPGGKNFPVIRLVVNRNETQIRVARTVAEMWKQELNIRTEVVIKEPAEIEEVRRSGEYDLIRRGVVMPTADEAAAIMAIFDMDEMPKPDAVSHPTPERQRADAASSPLPTPEEVAASRFTEETAIHELRAIPLYFPTSYSLVKPYVRGFEINSIDALSLLHVEIDNSWKPGQPAPAAAK
jgi:oligopeptide transport system substrate-binding protein